MPVWLARHMTTHITSARLVAVAPRDHASHLAHFLGEDGHVGQLAEVAHAILSNPSVDTRLSLLYCHNVAKVILF